MGNPYNKNFNTQGLYNLMMKDFEISGQYLLNKYTKLYPDNPSSFLIQSKVLIDSKNSLKVLVRLLESDAKSFDEDLIVMITSEIQIEIDKITAIAIKKGILK